MSRKKESRGGEIKMVKKLSPKEINKIIERFGQYGLRADEDMEHFTWQKPDGGKLFIPKQSEIPAEINGSLKYIDIADYLKLLFKVETQDEKNKT